MDNDLIDVYASEVGRRGYGNRFTAQTEFHWRRGVQNFGVIEKPDGKVSREPSDALSNAATELIRAHETLVIRRDPVVVTRREQLHTLQMRASVLRNGRHMDWCSLASALNRLARECERRARRNRRWKAAEATHP